MGFSRTSGFRITKRLIFLLFPLIVMVYVWLYPVTSIYSAEMSDTAEMENKAVSNFRIKIRRLQQGILSKEDEISESTSKEQNILSELEMLDKKIGQQQEKLSSLEQSMRRQQELIDKEELALTKVREEKRAVEEHLKKRIAAYYTMGDIGLLNVTFSAQTLPELLTFHDAFEVLIQYDQDVIKVYGQTIQQIERVRAALALEQSVLQEFIHQEVAEKEILESTKAEKHSLLTQVRTQTKLHQQAIQEMQQASDNLTRSIVAIKRKSETEDQGFLIDKGNLRPPVDGVIVTLFQQEKVNKLGVPRKSLGIELQAPDDTNIVAVGDGEVIYSGYLRGYGNTVIVHHGFQYYTVTARIEKILVSTGQKIKKDDPIGIMGGTATLFDEGLYFEIRHGNEPLDPLLWLNPNRLKTAGEHSAELPQEASPVQ
jgi:murein hydrolase activator